MTMGSDQLATMQGSLFEEDFLRRTLGDVVRVPDVALGELVANSWDAGAANVDIIIPDEHTLTLSVEDDGCGLDHETFKRRWMTLAYDRQKHQGAAAEFPPERSDWKRRAYGRNGQGRHALLCFADSYEVETWRDGTAHVFEVRVTQGNDPFVERLLRQFDKQGHGTRVSVDVLRNLPEPDRIRDLLSTRFLHDPQFTITVNGTSVPLSEQPGLIAEREIRVTENVRLKLYCVEGESKRTKYQSGVAFWVGSRLVGEPSWVVGGSQVLDGRTKPGRSLTFIIKTDDLYDEVLPDWTGFKRTELTKEVFAVVVDEVQGVLREVLSSRVNETRNEVMSLNRIQLRELGASDQVEVAEMVEVVTDANPLMDAATISSAVRGVIEAKTRRSQQALFERIMKMEPEDVEGWHRLLDEWTIRDAMTVLDEVGRRIKIVETLEKVEGDSTVDELHVLHPLVLQARWLFGPEFESPTYASNVSIRNAVKKVFGEHRPPDAFENSKKRPDLLFLPDSTLSAVATEDIDVVTGIARLRTVLLIELKKGKSTIGREEMNQADGYIEDLRKCGLLDGAPRVYSFVVGHALSDKLTPVRRVGDPEIGRIEAVTFGQLVRTANVRLFRLRDQIREMYPESGNALLDHLNKSPDQLDLLGLPH